MEHIYLYNPVIYGTYARQGDACFGSLRWSHPAVILVTTDQNDLERPMPVEGIGLVVRVYRIGLQKQQEEGMAAFEAVLGLRFGRIFAGTGLQEERIFSDEIELSHDHGSSHDLPLHPAP